MLTSPSTRKPGVILPIQYLRGIAALMVVWQHGSEQIPGLRAFFPNLFGATGVDLFFVISGFIMVITTRGTAANPREFIKRRIIRVVPLYWLLTLTMVALALLMPSLFKTLKVTPLTLIQSLLFIPHYSHSFPTYAWPLLAPGWTLNFEMFFYAMLAVTLYLPARRQLLTLVGLMVVLTSIGLVGGPFESAIASTYTDAKLLEFAIGVVMGAAWQQGRIRAPMAVSFALALGGAVVLWMHDSAPLGRFNDMAGATAIVFSALAFHWDGLRSKALQALGDSSYSLYLTHLFTLGLLRVVWSRALPKMPTWPTALAFMVVALALSTIVGWLSYRWIEMPLLRRLSGPRRIAPGVLAERR